MSSVSSLPPTHADATLETEQRQFSRSSLEYILFLQEVQERKKFEFVETGSPLKFSPSRALLSSSLHPGLSSQVPFIQDSQVLSLQGSPQVPSIQGSPQVLSLQGSPQVPSIQGSPLKFSPSRALLSSSLHPGLSSQVPFIQGSPLKFSPSKALLKFSPSKVLLKFSPSKVLLKFPPSRALLKFFPSKTLFPSPKKPLLNTKGGSTTRPSSLLIGRPQKSPSASLVLFVRITQKLSRAPLFLSNIWTHLSITPPVFYYPILSTLAEVTGFFLYRLRLLSMGAGSLFTIMTASLGVGACSSSNNKQWPLGNVHWSFNIWLKP
ncbi:hypothetical protein TNCV_2781431 [Trichonephila clavipes]|nr:hypothetical protein TNCV_2781431 [Trichonephila clavipes]